MTMTDEKLFAKYVKGDESSFTEMYNRHVAAVWALIMSIVRSEDIADDLTQETFMKLHANRSLRRGDTVKPFLHRIAYTSALEYKRKVGRKKTATTSKATSLPEEDVIAEGGINFMDTLMQGDESVRVREILLTLPEQHQQTISLHYLEGMSYTQMTEIWSVPLGTIKSWVRAAIQAFGTAWTSRMEQHGTIG